MAAFLFSRDCMTTLYLDTETFSTVPLKHGTHRYAEQSEIMLFQYAIDDGPVLVEEFDADHAQALIDQADKIIIQNSYFDRTLLSYSGVVVPVDKIEDTMVMALAHSLPGGLDPMCEVLAVPADKAKIKDGKKLINLFCKPRPKKMKLRRATKATHPKEWAAFIEYGRLDVEAMRECYKRLPRWNMTPSERKLWQLDQIINDRGILIDLHLAREALRAAAQAQQILSDRIDDMTDGVVKSARQRAKVKDYLESVHEFVMEDMTKAAVKAALANPNITGEMREMLEIRLQASATSPAKYTVLVNGTSTFDGRLRGILQFCGASRTSRWGGRLFQPQNLPRPTMKQKVIELGIRAIKLGMEAELFENVMELLASAVRGTLIAPKGRKLVISDLSNIEGRVSAWISGETWKVKAFKEFDRGIGHDIYVLAYARAYGVRPEDVIADMEHAQGLMRLIGKVMELALQYGGAVGAFTTMGANYGLQLEEAKIVEIVRKWRKAHPAITSFWYDVEWACRQAIRNKGQKFHAGQHGIVMDRVGKCLRIKMPSGSYLSYHNADEDEDGKLVYDGVNQYTKQWERIYTYGPKIFENIVQKIARDILAAGMTKAEDAGYDVCLHVHDELITETDDNEQYSHATLSGMMAAQLSWTLGLPLAAKGHEAYAYSKG